MYVEQVRQYIDKNLSDPEMNREKIASAVHISQDYLSYFFHKETGTQLTSYIAEMRIRRARQLLLSTDMTLEEIGEETGFSNSSYFHRQFKKITGLTPSAYRKQYGK